MYTIPTEAASTGARIAENVARQSLIPSHDLAAWLLSIVNRMLDLVGLERSNTAQELVYGAIVLGVSLLIGLVFKAIVVWVVRKVVAMRHSSLGDQILRERTIERCSHILPPLVFMCLIPFAFASDHRTLFWILRVVGIYTLFTFGVGISAIMEVVWERFENKQNVDRHPLKGVLNVCKGVLWIVVTIISVSILVDKSPMTLLAGLGAFAAALMLIFKDPILGFVAGIQLSGNDMLRVGDWIVVPSTIANGTVIDVSLTAVKVQNWDNTIVTLPPYTLVSTSFQNWRGMSDSGFRRVNRDVYFDQASIRPVDDAFVDARVAQYPILKDFVDNTRQRLARGEGNSYNPMGQPNGTIDTNLGLFRAYLSTWLLKHPAVGADQDLLVCLDPATEYGQALNIYFFSRLNSWAPYEAVLSEVMEHVAAVVPSFGLVLYNSPDRNHFTISAPADGAPAPVNPSPAPAKPAPSTTA